ncbi:DUF1048 domain-containing protein [Homoserinibacter sp. GY 40078]|uniref:DUF1048 domain-containing protein n=1 Tax=Homoserinibacter sp. GY 40078 TaxID=2603275 RepID=UPI0011CB6889|nr:DUF1048 domain-containing protein [Homoserinibacter sp. GY 40078]TXK16980.1 DUF1048 domain-containing protein [Homoserinibacter sp. GY 40078]
MTAKWIETITGPLEQKKQYRQYRAGIAALPEPYRAAAKATDRYLMYAGGITDGDALVRMLSDLLELWQRAVADGTALHDIVGDDPVEFVEAFRDAYSATEWIDKERARLRTAIAEAETAGEGS